MERILTASSKDVLRHSDKAAVDALMHDVEAYLRVGKIRGAEWEPDIEWIVVKVESLPLTEEQETRLLASMPLPLDFRWADLKALLDGPKGGG